MTEPSNPQREKIKIMLIIGTVVSTIIFGLIFYGFAESIHNMKEEDFRGARPAD